MRRQNSQSRGKGGSLFTWQKDASPAVRWVESMAVSRAARRVFRWDERVWRWVVRRGCVRAGVRVERRVDGRGPAKAARWAVL